MANRFIEASQRCTKKVKFLDLDLEIVKLTVGDVTDIQDKGKAISAPDCADKEQGNLEMLFLVCQRGAPELRDIEGDDLRKLPMDELSKLSTEIMKYAGLGNPQK